MERSQPAGRVGEESSAEAAMRPDAGAARLVLMASLAERFTTRDMSTLSDEEHAFRLHVMIHDN